MTERPPEPPLGNKRADRGKGAGEEQTARPIKRKSTSGNHCGDMGLASREKQFRPGSGGR